MTLEIIAALSANGVIGRDGGLPWHLPDDLKHFKATTLGHPVIMGRKTFESIGKPLLGRRTIVVSRTLAEGIIPGVEVVRSLANAEALVAGTVPRAFIVGGGVLYTEALPRTQIMHLTEIEADVEGDAFFPEFDRSQWRLASDTGHAADARHAHRFRFRTYQRM